ncbi:MAG: hypothetical protein AAF922_06625 [Pseudomonadota bacterium]
MSERPSFHRGGAPVGHIAQLGPVEAGAVMYLRLWTEGPHAHLQMREDFSATLGSERARKAVKSFVTLCDMMAVHGRRPLMRHQVTCRCLGADESWFAHFIGYASEGEREDALLISMMIVKPNVAPVLAGLAEEFGMALRSLVAHGRNDVNAPRILH